MFHKCFSNLPNVSLVSHMDMILMKKRVICYEDWHFDCCLSGHHLKSFTKTTIQ